MVQLAIRCHPGVPVSMDELEGSLEGQVDELRSEAPHAYRRVRRILSAMGNSPARHLACMTSRSACSEI